jgi:hypothetical protein
VDGKRRQKTVYSRTPQRAPAKLTRALYKHRLGLPVADGWVTLRQFLEQTDALAAELAGCVRKLLYMRAGLCCAALFLPSTARKAAHETEEQQGPRAWTRSREPLLHPARRALPAQ